MGFVTLIFLLTFTALYLSKSLEKKPELLTKAVDKITAHLDQVAMWASVYCLVAALLTLLMNYSTAGMLVRLAANVLTIMMALPFIFDRMVAKFQEKVNPAIMDEAKSLSEWVTRQEKYVSYTGAALALVLIGVIIR